MRQALAAKGPRGSRTSNAQSLPAPIGGWNARDSVANMSPGDAVILDNWFPDSSDVRVRRGYAKHVTGLPADVESLMCYNAADGTNTLFAASSTGFYNVTSAGAVGSAVQSSLTNARWYHENFTNTGGTAYLVCFNGEDGPRYWDGSSWITITGVSSPAITNVTPANLVFPIVHKRRLFIIEKDSLNLWYLPVDSVGGAAAKLDVAGAANKGGYLVAGGTWTIDGGEGSDDLLVLVTSEGQVLVYAGTDPASNYNLIGSWDLGQPLGRRCLLKFRGDLLLALDEGFYPLSQALQSAQTDEKVALSYKINRAMNEAAIANRTNFGWQPLHFPSANMLILNVPSVSKQQFVMNTVTKSWARFTNIPALCWANCGSDIFFGANTFVAKFWGIDSDDGANIEGDLLHAFNYLGSPGVIKKIQSIRPNLQSNGQPTVRVGINFNFKQTSVTGVLSFSGSDVFAWGDPWGSGPWGSGLNFIGRWLTVRGEGAAIAPRLRTESSGLTLRYPAVDLLYETGTVIG